MQQPGLSYEQNAQPHFFTAKSLSGSSWPWELVAVKSDPANIPHSGENDKVKDGVFQ